MKKRILKGRAAICPVILLAAASLVFSACGKKETEEMKETETSVAETEGSSGETGASTEDPVGSGEEIVEETGLLYPVVWTDYLSEYDETIGPLCSAEYQSPGIRNEEYPELSEALKAWSEENTAAVQKEYEELLAIAREDAGQREDFSGYSTDSSVQIVRADQKVFSFINEGYSYTGGAHGNGGTRGYSFDTETGEALLLSDVVTDKEAFTEYLISRLEEEYASEDMLLEGWQDQVRAETGQEESLSFSLTESGMRVYFSPYEIAPWAAGTITLDIPYGDEAAGLRKELFEGAEEKSVWSISPYEELYLDADGDGEEEKISFQPAPEGEGEDSYILQYTLTADGRSTDFTADYGISASYILRGDGQYYLYAECKSDNDWRYLRILNITALLAGEPEENNYYEAFYENVPVSARGFYLGTRGSLISTVGISREHVLGEEGLPEPRTETYVIDDLSLTAKKAVPATSPDQTEELEIPAGTKLAALETDESSYVIFRSEDGSLYRVEINGTDWPHTIAGEAIEDYFDGLIFAG